MRDDDTGIVPIVEHKGGGKLVGVVTDRDLCIGVLAERPEGTEVLNPASIPIKHCMTTSVVYCNPMDTVEKVLDLMQDNQIRRVLVVDDENNICVKAYQLVRRDFPNLPVIRMHLHKMIPVGSGLGGGSADGAFMLSLINEKFRLGLSVERMIDYSLQLGSDCPFFIINNPCYATGRGEFLEALSLNLSSYHFAIVCPDVHIKTGWAFEQLKLSGIKTDERKLKKIIKQPVESWREKLVNDFEEPVFAHYPEIRNIRQKLYDHGAIYASMSGSGSAVYGIFLNKPDLRNSFPPHYFVREV